MEDLPTLQSLADEWPRGTKPVYSWLTLTKCAISGSPNKSLSAEEVIQAIQDRFMFFTFDRAGDWKTFIINTLSNTPCFSPTGTGVFSPDELYWVYDHSMDKDRENPVFEYVPVSGPSTQSGSAGALGSTAAGASASTSHPGTTSGSNAGPSSPNRERSDRRKRREERERRRQGGERPGTSDRTTELREGGREGGRSSGREVDRGAPRDSSHNRERARTSERDAPPSREGPTQTSMAPRARTRSNPRRPPPLNFGTSSNLRAFGVSDAQQTVTQNQLAPNQYRAVLQHVHVDGQELPMPPRLGRERDPDTGSLHSFRSFRSLIDAATGAANGRDRRKSRDQIDPFQLGTPIAVPLPSSSDPPQTEQQRRRMEKEQEKSRKRMEKEQKREAEARRKAEEKERERAAKVERDGMKAPGLADKLKTIARGPSRADSNSSSISGHVFPPGEPGSAGNSYQSHSGAAGRGTPQLVVPQTNAPFVLDLLESAVCESPRHMYPLPQKNAQDGTLKKAKSFLLFWKGQRPVS